MITIKIQNGERPSEIFKKIAQAEADYDYWQNLKPAILPEYNKPPKVKKGIIGWYNFTLSVLKELKP